MKSIVERFYEKVGPATESGCWEWTAHRLPTGYGQFRFKNKAAYAHRVSWELTHQQDPKGFVVCHKCDNPPCVNPDHLFLGTDLDNSRDCVAKGRHAAGMKNGRRKLDDKAVLEIREAVGNNTQIAKRFGVSRPLVSMIRRGLIWKVL